MFIAWSAALTASWWHAARQPDQVLIILAFVLGASLAWFGVLSAVVGSAPGAGFGLLAAIVWWGLRYLGRVGDGFPGWFVLGQDLWGVGLVCCLVVAKVLARQPAPRLATQDDAKIYATREWGTPGQNSALSTLLGADDPELGRARDCQVVQRLEELVTPESARFIHGLRFAAAGTIDVDHAVVVGHRVALIEVKVWQPGIYSWDGPFAVLYYGERFQDGYTEIPMAASLCRAQLGSDVEVRAWVVVAPVGEADRHTYVLDNAGAPSGAALCRADEIDAIREWLVASEDAIDPALIRTLVSAHELHPASKEPALGGTQRRNRVKALPSSRLSGS